MPLKSIPPVNRSQARGRRVPPSPVTVAATPSLAANSGLKTPPASAPSPNPGAPATRPRRQGLSPPVLVSPSFHNVRVTRTACATTWQFPYGEFEVVTNGDEVHIEVRIGRFSDALILRMEEEKADL